MKNTAFLIRLASFFAIKYSSDALQKARSILDQFDSAEITKNRIKFIKLLQSENLDLSFSQIMDLIKTYGKTAHEAESDLFDKNMNEYGAGEPVVVGYDENGNQIIEVSKWNNDFQRIETKTIIKKI